MVVPARRANATKVCKVERVSGEPRCALCSKWSRRGTPPCRGHDQRDGLKKEGGGKEERRSLVACCSSAAARRRKCPSCTLHQIRSTVNIHKEDNPNFPVITFLNNDILLDEDPRYGSAESAYEKCDRWGSFKVPESSARHRKISMAIWQWDPD